MKGFLVTAKYADDETYVKKLTRTESALTPIEIRVGDQH